MRSLSLLISLILGLLSQVPAQSIQLHFPYFKGRPYVWYIMQGDLNDTLKKGLIPEDGRLTLVIPEAAKGYTGMSHWRLSGQSSGGLDLIINGEDYSVECLEEQPGEQNIVYTGGMDNHYLTRQYKIQQEILQKIDALRRAVKAYPEDDSLYPVFAGELRRLQLKFETQQAALAQNPLWAAKYTRIIDFTRGIADKTYPTAYEQALASNRFVVRELDWQALYNSGYWDPVIHHWVELNVATIKDDDMLIAGVRQILERIPGNQIYTDFAAKIAKYFIQMEKDALLGELGGEIKNSGRLLNTNGLLQMYSGLQKGDKAPVPLGVGQPNKFFAGGAAVIFYESDCPHCEKIMNGIIKDYISLKEAGIKVISIASDMDSTLYYNSIQAYPWPNKLCDFKGFEGENFKNYSVFGTPTIFLVDKKGMIEGRYATLNFGEILEKLKP